MSAVTNIRKILQSAIFLLAILQAVQNHSASAQGLIVPPPPAARADRFGVYHWNINNAAMPADESTNELNWGADLVAGLGTRTIRIALVTRDDYRLNLPDNLDLVQLAKLPAYDRVLRDARFRTIMLTTYSRGDMASNWSDGYTQAEYDAERDEIRRLGVKVDYYSYSSWRSLDDKVGNPAENLKQRYKADLTFALSLIKTKRPEIGEHNFILGEYGFERARYGECQAANHTSEMFDALEGEGAFQDSYAVFWQIVDNAPNYGVGVGLFGLHRVREGRLSLSPIGENFRKRLAGEAATNYTGCPQIRTSPGPGVLNHQGLPNFQINPDTVVSIYAQGCCTNVTTPFSPMDNIVHFNQTARNYSLPRDNAEAFYESPAQINFSMPAARRTGFALVFVTDGRGYDSNSETIAITCADCPRLAPSCGLLETVYQTLHIAPGDTINLAGEQFSPSGNTIVIEQLVTQQTFQKWILPRQSLLSESPTEIGIDHHPQGI